MYNQGKLNTYNFIWHDLDESPINYYIDELNFIFSSSLNRQRFIKKRSDNLIRLEKQKKSFLIEDVNLNLIANLKAYVESEKRGFKIITKDNDGKVVEYKCRKEMMISLNLQSIKKKS